MKNNNEQRTTVEAITLRTKRRDQGARKWLLETEHDLETGTTNRTAYLITVRGELQIMGYWVENNRGWKITTYLLTNRRVEMTLLREDWEIERQE